MHFAINDMRKLMKHDYNSFVQGWGLWEMPLRLDYLRLLLVSCGHL